MDRFSPRLVQGRHLKELSIENTGRVVVLLGMVVLGLEQDQVEGFREVLAGSLEFLDESLRGQDGRARSLEIE